MISVEKATVADCSHIAIIHNACWSEVYSFIPKEVHRLRSVEYRRQQWVDALQNAEYGDALFVLRQENRIVGFGFSKACGEEGMPAMGELHAAYILKAYRGGVGGPLLMRAMVRSLVGSGLEPISLWAFKENKMKHTYRALGWRRMVERDRVIEGYKIPEIGYIHPNANDLLGVLDRFVEKRVAAAKRSGEA